MTNRFDQWSDLRVFLAVLRTGSTLAAARTLRMSQPTVARRIDALEHTLRVVLFERDTRGFHPTAAARDLAAPAMAVETAVESFTGAAERAGQGTMKPIRFTAPTPNFSARLAGLLTEFSDANPGTSFELLSTYNVLDLAAGEADVAVRMAREIDDDRLICTRLSAIVQATLYASKEYAARHGLPRTEAELAGHRFVVADVRYKSFAINRWLLDRVAPAQIVSRGSNLEAVITAIQAELGIGPAACSMAADHPDLVRCFPPPEGLDVSSWLLITPEAYRRPEVRAFSAFFAPRYRALFRQPTEPGPG